MKVAMLRVGIDTGSGGIHGPLFRDHGFEYVPIPDGFGIDPRTYGNTVGRHGRKLIDYFPPSRRARVMGRSMHFDPESSTFTYGDPTPPKAGLRRLEPGDMLIFYCGLEGWDFQSEPALYLMGYFEVEAAGRAGDFGETTLKSLFCNNFHVLHPRIHAQQRDSLVLVKGSANSRLFTKAVLFSAPGQDRSGRPLKVISPEMRRIFGDFGGRISFQRSPTRWVAPAFTAAAAEYVRSLT
jgi:hypothetical protein